MEYGVLVLNKNEFTQIDGSFLQLAVLDKGVVNKGQFKQHIGHSGIGVVTADFSPYLTIDLPDGFDKGEVFIFAKPRNSTNVEEDGYTTGDYVFGMEWLSDTSFCFTLPSNKQFSTSRNWALDDIWGEDDATHVDYVIAATKAYTLPEDSLTEHGLRVFNDAGEIAFNSDRENFIVESIENGKPGINLVVDHGGYNYYTDSHSQITNYFDNTEPVGIQDYYCLMNELEGIAAWQDPGLGGQDMNQQSGYPLHAGAQHYYCFVKFHYPTKASGNVGYVQMLADLYWAEGWPTFYLYQLEFDSERALMIGKFR